MVARTELHSATTRRKLKVLQDCKDNILPKTPNEKGIQILLTASCTSITQHKRKSENSSFRANGHQAIMNKANKTSGKLKTEELTNNDTDDKPNWKKAKYNWRKWVTTDRPCLICILALFCMDAEIYNS